MVGEITFDYNISSEIPVFGGVGLLFVLLGSFWLDFSFQVAQNLVTEGDRFHFYGNLHNSCTYSSDSGDLLQQEVS